MNRTQELEELILYHNDKYFNDEPEISDVEYDALVEELRKLDPTNSALVEVGATPSYGKRVVHDKIMGSLIKKTFVKDDNGDIVGDGLDDLRKWEDEHPEKKRWGYKIDGLAGKLVYKNAKLLEASSRGNGKIGSDLSDNVRAIRSIPTKIESEILESYAGKAVSELELTIKGEFYIPWSFFNANMVGKYSNPRNAASGSIQCEDPNETAERGLEFLVYEILIDGENPLSKSDEEMIVNSISGYHGILKTTFKFNELYDDELTAEKIEELDQARANLEFMADGLVLSVDDRDARDAYGILSERYPKGAVAFKFKAEQVTTTVVGVEWQTGRTGKITPVAILDPVQIAGTIVGRATLHNLSEIKRLGISIGDEILLQKSGDIIPNIIRVENGSGSKEYNYPDVCPSCGSYTSNDDTNVWCENTECGAKLLTRIDYYLKTLDIKEIGPAMIQALIDAGFVKNIVDMYYLNEDQIMELPNSGLRTAQTVMNAVLSKSEVDLAVFLPALGIHGLGKTTGKLLAKKFKTLDAVRNVTIEELVEIEGIAYTTASAIVNGLSESAETIDGLSNLINIKGYETVQGVFTGKNFCCTGTLSRKRKDIQQMIAEAGGEYTSISKNLNILIIGEGAVQKKIDKAKSLGAEVIEEEKFVEMLG